MSNPDSKPAEFRPDDSDSANQPGFLDRIDSALGLHMAEQSPKDAANANGVNDLRVIVTEEGKDTQLGQLVSSPSSATQELKPSSAPMRPGFFGAGGSMYVTGPGCSRDIRF
jgi:hypothetical protein